MNYEEIRTFLEVVEKGNLLKAAETLFISPGTASKRIKNIENEIGAVLLYRSKGIKEVELTKEGERFIPIAQQWLALYRDAQHIKDENYFQTYHVAANSLLNELIMPVMYQRFMADHPDLLLYVQTEHSTEAHRLVSNQILDAAIVYTAHNLPDIVSEPLFHERMVIVCHRDSVFNKTGELSDLSDIHEIGSKWSAEYETWHRQYFPYAKRNKIVVGSASMIGRFLTDPDDWAIVSKIVADQIVKSHPDYMEVSNSGLPVRTAYLITNKYPKFGVRELNEIFRYDLLAYLKEITGIQVLANVSSSGSGHSDH